MLNPPLRPTGRRIRREQKTIAAMVRVYCRARHGRPAPAEDLCPECAELLAYAHARLQRCRLGELKPTCAACTVHCYAPALRERVRTVMRFAGPRMIYRHPVMAVRHLLDGRRSPNSS